MPTVEESIVIAATPEEVFDCLDDPANLPAYDPTVLRAELVGNGPVRVGSRAKGTSKILGRTFDWVVEVTEEERPTRQSVRSVGGKIDLTSTTTVLPEGDGSRVTFRLETAPGLGGVFGRIADALVGKAYARQTRANLAEILTEHKKNGAAPD